MHKVDDKKSRMTLELKAWVRGKKEVVIRKFRRERVERAKQWVNGFKMSVWDILIESSYK